MKQYGIAVLTFLLMLGCKEKVVVTDHHIPEDVTISLKYEVNGEPLTMNMIMYNTLAGNNYSVTDMRYLLSDFVFHATDGSEYRASEVFYADADRPDLDTLEFKDVPFGSYTAISFVIGLRPDLNINGGLPNVADFNNMTWPDGMGGGYHFMRFEGHFIDSVGDQKGFAWHLGNNSSIMPFHMNHGFSIDRYTGHIGDLTMDIDRYFYDPITIDLDTTLFSMMNVPQMQILAENGLDVFTID